MSDQDRISPYISVQYQPDTGGVSDENKGKYQFGNN